MTKKIPCELIIEDIKKVIAETNDTKFKTYKEHGKYSESTINKNFGNWTNFLKREGYINTQKRGVSKEELVADIKKVFEKTHCTKQENYLLHGKFSRSIIKRIFGSWNKMLKSLGYQLNMLKPDQYTKEDILTEYKQLKEKLGYPLSAAEFRKYGKYSQPIIDRVFGSFTAMKKELGEVIDARFLSNEELEQDILSLYQKYKIISEELIYQESIVSYPTIIARYGSLDQLCKKIGIPCDPLTNKSKLLIQCLASIKSILGNEYILEKTFSWLKNPKTNRPLYIDIFYPKLKLAIEIDGGQHSKICCFAKTPEALLTIQARDRAKDDLVKKHGMKILRLTKPSYKYIKEQIENVI